VNPYFLKEYDAALRNYSLPQAMRAVSLLSEYDFKGKGGDAGEATPAELFTELVVKLLNI
jgi:DNA polymerase-3 subunit delta